MVHMDLCFQQNIQLFLDMLETVLHNTDQQMIVNFDYNALHSITTTQSGHFSPVLDMHRTSGMICILDVDDDTVPYWVPVEQLIYSMTIQTTCCHRGYLVIHQHLGRPGCGKSPKGHFGRT
jgi:hypothetical protein